MIKIIFLILQFDCLRLLFSQLQLYYNTTIMDAPTRFYQNLSHSYTKKSYLLKSKPESFTRETLKIEHDENYLNLVKIYIPIDYNKSKPNCYQNKQNEKSDYEIFEPVDTEKFNFTKKNQKETNIMLKQMKFQMQTNL